MWSTLLDYCQKQGSWAGLKYDPNEEQAIFGTKKSGSKKSSKKPWQKKKVVVALGTKAKVPHAKTVPHVKTVVKLASAVTAKPTVKQSMPVTKKQPEGKLETRITTGPKQSPSVTPKPVTKSTKLGGETAESKPKSKAKYYPKKQV